MSATLQLSSLRQALEHLDGLRPANAITVPGAWSWAQTLEHCAQSIDCSIDGYPKLKPRLVRATIGRWVVGRFVRRGWFHHDLAAPVPGAPAVTSDDAEAAHLRLRDAIERYLDHDGPLRPHFVFGDPDKPSFDKVHAMHLADHFAAVSR